MGYITSYNLLGYNSEREFVDQAEMDDRSIEKIFDWVKFNTAGKMQFDWLDDAKWYSWDEDMTKLSLAYPDVIFELYGDGEETDDVWKAVFYRGKGETVNEISYFPAINMSKLGMSNPYDPTAPEEEPENAYFFAEE